MNNLYYVYILQGDKKHYIGYTNDLKRRLAEHKKGQTKFSESINVNKLIGYFEKETRFEAIKLENMIKRDGHIKHWINHNTFVLINEDM